MYLYGTEGAGKVHKEESGISAGSLEVLVDWRFVQIAPLVLLHWVR